MLPKIQITRYLVFIFYFYLSFSIRSQPFNPVIDNYSKKNYHAASQNWSIAQDQQGFVYAGNNNGLLQFDGNSWRIYTIPGAMTVRSIMIDKDDKIYIGSFEEFGYFLKNNKGVPEYHSLSDLLEDFKLDNDEIWNIFESNGLIIFQSFSSFFVYNGSDVKGFKLPQSVIFFMPWQATIYAYGNGIGLCTVNIKDGTLQKTEGYSTESPTLAILPYKENKALLFTLDDGIYLFDGTKLEPFSSQVSQDLINANVNKVILTGDSTYVIGTLHNGLIAMNTEGKKVWQISTNEGLQNNTVLGLSIDHAGNIWAALDKGISVIKQSSPMRFFSQFDRHLGAIYDLQISGDILYIGTNQGLYSCKTQDVFNGLDNAKVNMHSKINNQVWDITNIDQQIFCGNNEETYELSEKGPTLSSHVKGGYCIRQGTINGSNILIQSTYSNLCIYRKDSNEKWIFSHTIDGFLNPVRYVEIDYLGNIWASHIHKGLFLIKLEDDLKTIQKINFYDKLAGTSKKTINVFSINQRIVFCNGDKVYTYNDLDETIVPYHVLNEALGIFKKAHRIIFFKENFYWFIRPNEAALVRISDNEIKIIDIIPFSSFPADHVDEHQNIVPISSNQCIFCLENGLGLYTFDVSPASKSLFETKLLITQIQVRERDEKVHATRLPLNNQSVQSLRHDQNYIRFTVALPEYSEDQDVLFSYRLSNHEKHFSTPEHASSKVYNNLGSGKYRFEAKTVDMVGTHLASTFYDFEILPPFYLSFLAFCFYAFMSLLLVLFISLRIRIYIHKKQLKMEADHELLRSIEIESQEKEIIKLKNQTLESELKYKSKELASSAMLIIRKNDILLQIKNELIKHKEILGVHYPKKYFDKVVKVIDSNIGSDDDWSVFQQNFDRIHENFFRNLKSRFPVLTAHDLRFCAYLRLNLSSKEIANLQNISLKGVEISRYRIRKKLELAHQDSLNDFLVNLK